LTQLVHQLVGYDRKTEKVVDQHDITASEWNRIRIMLHADLDDPQMVDVYRIDEPTVRNIVEIIHKVVRADLDYFIECSIRD
jgi:hypothetical protein